MSEIGLLLNQYDLLAETTDTINNSIISLKKWYIISLGDDRGRALSIKGEELQLAKQFIVDFIDYLVKLNDESVKPDYTIIPQKVVDRFKKTNVDFLQSDKKLIGIKKAINEGKLLNEDELKLLDAIVTHLDMARSVLFKNLRTAHG